MRCEHGTAATTAGVLRRLFRGRRVGDQGTAAMEFAFVAPVFLAMVGAILEFSTIMFVQTLLEGGAREAARFGITGRTVAGETREQQIRSIIEAHSFGMIDMEQLDFETLVYESFDNVGKPEPFTDVNGNDAFDVGETYVDVNGNGTWDQDMGAAGLGGPGDIVVYRLGYDWDIIIPLFDKFFPPDGSIRLDANIAVRNEPYPGGAPEGEE